MAFLIAINTSRINKLPKDTTPAEWARYNDAFRNVELTSGELAGIIRAGYAIAPQCDGRRKASNFLQAQHIGIDLDDGTHNWDDLVTMPLVDGYASIIHTTASYTPENHRYRVLFLLEEPITNPTDYTHAVRVFMRAFGAAADAACKDPARLFFGAKDCSLLHMPDNIVTADDLASILAKYPPDTPTITTSLDGHPPASVTTVTPPPADAGGIVSPSDLAPARRDAHLAALLSKIRYCPDGEKWATLREVSYTLGGYVASGYFTFSELQTALQGAIETRRSTVASMPAAYQTIEQGLRAGMSAPLYYQVKERRNGRQHADAPPADARHRLRWIMERRIAELEDAILAADMETCPDFESMAREYSILQERLAA